MERLDVDKGIKENKILGKHSASYANLMVHADVLYHDTIKGISKNIKNPETLKLINTLFDQYFEIKKKEKNAKIKGSRLITKWSEAVQIAFIEIEANDNLSWGDKLKAEAEVLGRADVPFTYFLNNCDEVFTDIPEEAMDYFNCIEYNMTLTEIYREIWNSDYWSDMMRRCSTVCRCILPFIQYVFEWVEGQE